MRMDTPAELLQYTPITAAAIYKTPPHNKCESSSPALWSEGDEFVPKFQTMSARNRKMMDLYGEVSAVKSAPRSTEGVLCENNSVSSARRRRGDSPLIPSTMQWSCSPSMRASGVCEGENKMSQKIRRPKSELISASTSWTAPSPYPNPSSGAESVNHRKKPLGLLPATMPWVTQVPCLEGRSSGALNTDHRKKKGLTEEQSPQTGSLFVDGVRRRSEMSPITSSFFRPESVQKSNRFLETTKVILAVQKPDGNEEAQVRKALCGSGLHVVQAKAETDILSNTTTGRVHVTVRHEAETPVIMRIDEIAVENGLSRV